MMGIRGDATFKREGGDTEFLARYTWTPVFFWLAKLPANPGFCGCRFLLGFKQVFLTLGSQLKCYLFSNTF